MLETSGYRPEPQTLNISVCDEQGNCTRSTVSSAGADVQPPHRHTGVAGQNRCPPAVRNPLILDVQINHQRALQGARYRFRIQECNDES